MDMTGPETKVTGERAEVTVGANTAQPTPVAAVFRRRRDRRTGMDGPISGPAPGQCGDGSDSPDGVDVAGEDSDHLTVNGDGDSLRPNGENGAAYGSVCGLDPGMTSQHHCRVCRALHGFAAPTPLSVERHRDEEYIDYSSLHLRFAKNRLPDIDSSDEGVEYYLHQRCLGRRR